MIAAFRVTAKAHRPARMDGTCFYCRQAIGSDHQPDCVLIRKKVKIRMIVEYEAPEPASWTAEQIESMRNDGSWCASNALGEIKRAFAGTCLCGAARFEHVADTSEAYLEE